MNSYETVAETKWGVKKVKRDSTSIKTLRYSRPMMFVAELPLRAAGSVVPFALGNLAGEILERTPVIDQYTSSSTNMLLGILGAAYGFTKSGLELDENMELSGMTITPLDVSFEK